MLSESTAMGGYHFQFNSEKQWSQTAESISSRFRLNLKQIAELLSSIPFDERHQNGSHINENLLRTKNSSICNNFTYGPITSEHIDHTRSKHYKNLIASRVKKSSSAITHDETNDLIKIGSFSISSASVDIERDLQDISKVKISNKVLNSEMSNSDCMSSNSSYDNNNKITTELDNWLEDILH